MDANPIKIEDLIARAVQAGEIVEGINDPKTLFEYSKAQSEILVEALSAEHRYATVFDVSALLEKATSVVKLLSKALRIAGSPERLSEWLQTPVPALNGQTPYSLMHTEEGCKQVEDVLGRIEHGVY